MNLRTLARKVKRSFETHRPLVEVGISRSNLLHNLNTYKKKYPHLKFAPVLKSDAYGHGLTVIAELLDKQDIAFFMVDSYFEARTLRRAGIRSRILILGYVRPEEIASSNLPNIDYGIVDLEQLRELTKKVRKPTLIHLKIDTGMHRQGILPHDILEAIDLIKSQPHLQLVGICSHFADADNPTSETFTKQQIIQWSTMAKELLLAFPSIEYRHLTATKGARFAEETGTNVIRIGEGLFGFDMSPQGVLPLKPVLEMRSIITSVKELDVGESVGYNATYTANRVTHIATVPLGYFEGIDRRLSNKGAMLVDGIACPIVGMISMNMATIDVSSIKGIKPGDEVVAISRDPGASNSIRNITKLISVSDFPESNNVTLVHIPQHLKRVVD
jgi:alanine racemase